MNEAFSEDGNSALVGSAQRDGAAQNEEAHIAATLFKADPERLVGQKQWRKSVLAEEQTAQRERGRSLH